MTQGNLLIRLLQPWWRMTRGVTLGVRGAVFDDAGRVMLVRHSYAPGWHLPGGGVEHGESVAEALARELREEAGVAPVTPPRLHGIFCNRDIMPGDHVAVFVVDEWRRDESWRAGLEIRAAELFPVTDLPDGTTPGTRRRLAEIAGAATPAERW